MSKNVTTLDNDKVDLTPQRYKKHKGIKTPTYSEAQLACVVLMRDSPAGAGDDVRFRIRRREFCFEAVAYKRLPVKKEK